MIYHLIGNINGFCVEAQNDKAKSNIHERYICHSAFNAESTMKK